MNISAGIILGSGIDILPFVNAKRKLDIRELNLPQPGVMGHAPFYTIAEIGGKNSGIFSGRVHLYEGFSPEEVCSQIKFLKEQGAERVVLTNASGIVNRRFSPGTLMLIKDQINLSGCTPFDFKRDKQFTDCSNIYNKEKFKNFKRLCNKFKVKLYLGVLAGVRGPEYETPAEVKFLKRIGADAVCMSTVLEAMYAHSQSMDVLGISVLANYAGMHSQNTHSDIISVAKNLSRTIYELIEFYLKNY